MIETLTLIALYGLIFFLSLAETALVKISPTQIYSLQGRNKLKARKLTKIKENMGKTLTSILTLQSLSKVAVASVSAIVLTSLFGVLGALGSIAATFLLMLFVGNIVPKTLALQNTEEIALMVAAPVMILSKVVAPISLPLSYLFRKVNIKGKKKELTLNDLEVTIDFAREKEILTSIQKKAIMNIILKSALTRRNQNG
tara:strand:+ start:1784 stop:2380 length:597 start_codon:yes stop_codon:yes gene_type:complete